MTLCRRIVPERHIAQVLAAAVALGILAVPCIADSRVDGVSASADVRDPLQVAAEVDRLIEKELQAAGAAAAPLTIDDDFLRRITFDLAGTIPTPNEVTYFGIDPNPNKRRERIASLLESGEFAENWSRYWSEVIYSHATDMRSRLGQQEFESWLAEQFKQNRGWGEIVTDLLTAEGNVRENGATGLMFAHGGDPAELAAESSRIFLGIQIQCANCHDHPTDQWKRSQFHELAAYFPRVRVRPVRDAMPRSFEVVSFDVDPRSRNRGRGAANFLSNPEFLMRIYDRNRDGKLTEAEVSRNRGLSRVFDRLLEVGDRNKDGGLDVAEFNELPPPDFARQRGSTEYFMPDLNDPSSEGERIDPVFFVNKTKPKSGLNDVERRESLARSITSRKNPWFAKAFVNRIWGELLGQGFYMPIDDLGPERKADYPEVLDLLSDGFTASGYDVKWLFRTIANTHTYQRQIQSVDASESTIPFVAATPTRLRGDQVYNAILKVLGTNELGRGRRGFRPIAGGGGYPGPQTPRVLFGFIFGFDPSTPQEDIIGSVPQALFMMNSSLINGMVRGSGNTRLGTILRNNRHDADAVKELYLLVLSRQPSDKEIEICLDYVGGNSDRQEAFEDVMWGLLNSSEFLTKR